MEGGADQEIKTFSKLVRVDFLGAAILASLILSLLLPMELGGNEVTWTHPLIFGLFGAAAFLLIIFVLVEKHWAKEPILDLVLFTQRDVMLSYLIMAFQSAAQFGVSSPKLDVYRMLLSIVLMKLLNSFTIDDIFRTSVLQGDKTEFQLRCWCASVSSGRRECGRRHCRWCLYQEVGHTFLRDPELN